MFGQTKPIFFNLSNGLPDPFFPFGLFATLTMPLGAVTATASAASGREQLT